ncbi:hypothetical protein GGI09_002549 [Coemansia sp. S100]|nr:hypothetical protein LPJ71_005400 [Coemansia sp. S17]KAJ2099883.1 hypothetical protein GGI09_002549 [Coemansia sp. S100]KAJ2101747.1 hypothetical protein GGI16_003368 [Coemansia sp. S142-1]
MSHTHISTTRSAAVCLAVLATLGVAYPLASGSLGEACQPRTIFCADGDGISPRYLKCENGSLAMSYCPGTSICVGSRDTTVFCAADGNLAKSSIRSSHGATTTTTTLTVEFDSTSTQGVTRGDFFLVASTPTPSHSIIPARAPVSSTTRAGLAVLGSPHVLSPPLNQFLPQIPSTWRSVYLQPAHSLAFVPFSQTPSPRSSEPNTLVHSQPTATPELSQQPLQRSPLWQQQSTTRNSDPTTTEIPLVTTRVSMVVFSSSIMTIARPANDVIWSTKTTWVLKPLPSQTSTIPSFSSAPIATPSAHVARIGGIEVPRVLSVIASAFLAHRSGDYTSDSDEETPFMLSIDKASTDAARSTTSMLSSAVSQSMQTSSVEPARAQIRVCNPGAFICEANGQRPMYFACDSLGMALPASCASNEVCYQYGDAILCDAPGSNVASQHKRIAML